MVIDTPPPRASFSDPLSCCSLFLLLSYMRSWFGESSSKWPNTWDGETNVTMNWVWLSLKLTWNATRLSATNGLCGDKGADICMGMLNKLGIIVEFFEPSFILKFQRNKNFTPISFTCLVVSNFGITSQLMILRLDFATYRTQIKQGLPFFPKM